MALNPNYSCIETWRKKSELTQEELCKKVNVSVRTYRSIVNGETRKRTDAVMDAISSMANILSPDDPTAFLRDVFGIGNIKTIIDDINAAIPYAPFFVSKVIPLFFESSNPIDCSEIISSFTAILCNTYGQLSRSDRKTARPFLTEMACELSMCHLESDPHTLEPIWASLIHNMSSLADNGIPSNEVAPVLDFLRDSRIHNIHTDRLKAVRAAFFTIYDNFYSINSPEATSALCYALSDISVLCTDYTRPAPDTFYLGFAIYEYCIALSAIPPEVGNA